MKKTISVVLLLLSFVATLNAQVVVGDQFQVNAYPKPISPSLPLAQIFGTAGTTSTRFYWVSAVYPQGESRFNGPVRPLNGPAALGAVNYIRISWSPVPGATSYNVVRTASATYPATGSILVANTTSNFTDDKGAALTAYVLPTYSPAAYYSITAGPNGVPVADNFGGSNYASGTNFALAIQDCINRLPWSGGVCDASALQGSISVSSSTLTINKPVKIILNPNLTLTASTNALWTFNSNGIDIDCRGATLSQSTAGVNILTSGATTNSFSSLKVHGCHFIGPGTGSGDQVGANPDNGIYLENTTTQQTDISIYDNTFTKLLHDSIWVRNAARVNIHHNRTFASIGGIRLTGIQGGTISQNFIGNGSETSAAPAASTAIQLESTNLQTYGQCLDITISGNVLIEDGTAGYARNSQAILVHGGKRIAVTGNIIRNFYQGIALAAFNATDFISSSSIIGNSVIGNISTETGGGGPNAGIIVAGSGAATADDVVVSGNNLSSWNQVQQNSGYGAIEAALTNRLRVNSNVIDTVFGSCVVLLDVNNDINISHNSCTNVSAATGIAYGIFGASGSGAQQGLVAWNYVNHAQGIGRFNVSTTTLSVGNNYGLNLSDGTAYVSPGNVSMFGLSDSATQCVSTASPAACGSASTGFFTIAAGATTKVVNTKAVGPNSKIILLEDQSLGTALSVTCNTQSTLTLGTPIVSARTSTTSFTAAIQVGPTTNPMCISYAIIN